MKSITVYHKDRKIILREKTAGFEDQINNLEVDEPFIHKCNDRMGTILKTFFEREAIKEISFEYFDFDKLLNDFKSHFKYIEAAGGLVKNKNDKLLVIHRLGVPDLPKGKLDEAESPKEAALREVTEECGIDNLQIIGKDEPSYHIYLLNDKYVLKKTFWFHMTYTGNKKPVPQTEESITDVEWCNIELLTKYKDKTYSSLRRYFI